MANTSTKQETLETYSEKLKSLNNSLLSGKDKAEAARKLNCDVVTVYRYLRGEAKKPKVAKKMYEVLSVLAAKS
jgi:DNA invertase Pin-like site-specific DNA recombinase